MVGTYDPIVVALSVLIAVVAAYTALDMATRVMAEAGRRRLAWLVAGSSVMGIGIWSMHFVGMLAFQLPITAAYEVPLTALSAIIAILASALALVVVSRERRAWTLIGGGVLFGLAISGMHYTGMAAMRMPARIVYDPFLVALSIAIAVGAASGALGIMFRLGEGESQGLGPLKMAGGVVLGFAIVGMHYTGMAAAEFIPTGAGSVVSGGSILGTMKLTALVAIAALAILSLALTAASADRNRLVLLVEQARREAAESARERVINILESITDHFIALDREWRFTYVNAKAEEFFARPREQLLGQRIWDLFPDKDGRSLQQRYRNALAGDGPVSFETESAIVPGRWLDIRAYPSEDGLSVYFRDITEAKEAERSARTSEERYRLLFERSPIGIYRSTPQGELVTANPAMARMLGYSSPEELIEHRVSEFAYASSTDRDRFLAAMERDGEVRGLETVWRRRDGTSIHIREHARAVRSEDGAILYYEGSIEDVTDRKQAEEAVHRSEQRFRAFTERLNDIVTVLDAEGVVTYESPSGERVLGYTPEERVGTNAFAIVHPEDLPRVMTHFQKALESADQLMALELRCRHKDGTWRILHVQGRNLLDDNAVDGIVVNSRDVTEQRELEKKLLQSQKMEAVGQLAGGIAHDFNNLLTGIQGHALLLMEGVEDDEALRADAEEIASAAERATGLTRQLLTFSRREIVQPRRLDLNSVVREMEGMLRRLISAEIDLRVDLTEENVCVRADLTHLQQVVLNLAVNGRDAMREGGTLRIATRRIQVSEDRPAPGAPGTEMMDVRRGRYAALLVEDTGQGMDTDTLKHIFEPFFTTKGTGTGLGLSTVHGIVKQSGGAIDVETAPGEGTTFTIYLPSAERETEHDLRPPTARKPPSRTGDPSMVTVLIVEDEPAVRSLARKVLRRRGYRVLDAENGRSALKLVEDRGRGLDLVVTDVVMPEMGGRELVDILRQDQPELSVLFMSGYTQDEVVKRGISRAEVLFLEKPFSPAQLLTMVQKALGVVETG